MGLGYPLFTNWIDISCMKFRMENLWRSIKKHIWKDDSDSSKGVSFNPESINKESTHLEKNSSRGSSVALVSETSNESSAGSFYCKDGTTTKKWLEPGSPKTGSRKTVPQPNDSESSGISGMGWTKEAIVEQGTQIRPFKAQDGSKNSPCTSVSPSSSTEKQNNNAHSTDSGKAWTEKPVVHEAVNESLKMIYKPNPSKLQVKARAVLVFLIQVI